MRIEKDALGEIAVPDGMYYGAQTERAKENFPIGTELFPPEFIRAHALVKKAAARVNARQGRLDEKLAQAIEQAADEVIAGQFDGHFPLVVWQSGSGTQFNMNMNEVLAHRANEILTGKLAGKAPVHPNDHVNMAQSTNDTIPTSIHIAGAQTTVQRLLPALDGLIEAFDRKSRDFAAIIKIGRTHMQDATPVTLGQEFSGYTAQLRHAARVIKLTLDFLYELAIGGTAVGTGLSTKEGYDRLMAEEIANLTGLPFRVADNKFAALSSHEAVICASSALKTLAASLIKIATDLRLLSSGPRSGIGELILPANELGSSIMPGKINPTQCEMITMVGYQVFGNDTAIGLAGMAGSLEVNVFKPMLAYNLLQSITLLADGCSSFHTRCVAGIEPNRKQIERHLENSLMLATALSEHIGYDKTAQITLKAHREDKTLREAALELGYVTPEQFTAWVDPRAMLGPEK